MVFPVENFSLSELGDLPGKIFVLY